MGFNPLLFALGAGEFLTARRGVARGTVTVKAATVPTVNYFVVTAAEVVKIREGDILAPAAQVFTNTLTEATGLPRITSIVASGADYQVNVSPPFGAAPAAGANLPIAYNDGGATDGGIELKITTESELQYCDQSIDPVNAILKARKVEVMIPMAELTLKNLALCIGLETPAGDTLDIDGMTAGAPREDMLLVLLAGPNGKKRWFKAHRVINMAEAVQKASKTEKGIFKANFVALPDPTQAPKVGQFKDV